MLSVFFVQEAAELIAVQIPLSGPNHTILIGSAAFPSVTLIRNDAATILTANELLLIRASVQVGHPGRELRPIFHAVLVVARSLFA